MTELRAFSFGCGVQSVAALVLASRREIDFPLFVFANVGAGFLLGAALIVSSTYRPPK